MKILLILITLLYITGCSDHKMMYKTDSKVCLDKGGVPIRSVIDYDLLVDCVFPPVKTINRGVSGLE